MNSRSLCGSLGESAVHIAAATGSLDALTLLLQLGMDVNAEDNLQEGPLHYAALTGNAACAKVCLRYGALCGSMSSYGETPLDVANDNIAEFLGVDTSSVKALLEAWTKIDDL